MSTLEYVVREFTPREWDEIISRFEDVTLLQTWEFGEARARGGRWQVSRGAFVRGSRIVGAVQALVRRAPLQGGLVWVNRGPVSRPEGSGVCNVVEMLAQLRRTWVEERGMVLRIAPPLPAAELDLAAVEARGFRFDRHVAAWISACVDLSEPVETLRARLDRKWRNSLTRAERLPITVDSATESTAMDAFLREYAELLRLRRFETSVTPELLAHLHASSPPGRKPHILTARQDERTLGRVLIVRYGRSAEYLAGVIPHEGRALSVGQLLLWRGVCEMKERGCRWFDLGGTHPRLTSPGILHFKDGLGGSPYAFVGEFDASDGRLISRVIRSRASRARRAAGYA